MTETTYRIIGYGVANHGFFNQFNFSGTREGAMTEFQRLIGDPEMDGAVVIEVNHEDWRVVAEFTADYTISIAYGPLGTFKVERAPQLVLV